MKVANTSGFSATEAGTVLPPATPARMSWNMSAAYRREQEGHSLARRLPHRTWVTPSGSCSLEYEERTSPVPVSMVSEWPRRRIGWAQLPTRASAWDQASNFEEVTRPASCCDALGDSAGMSSGAPSPNPGNASGTTLGRASWTRARVRVLTDLTTPKGVPRG